MASAPQTAAAQLQAPPESEADGAIAGAPLGVSERGGRLQRYPDRGILGGVAAGVSVRLGVPAQLVRFAMVLMLAVGGVGVAMYVLAWALLPVAPESEGVERPRGAWREAIVILLGALTVLYGLRRAGLLLGDSMLWPLVLATFGLVLVWRPTVARDGQSAGRRRLPSPRELLRRPGRVDSPRLLIGVMLVAFASAALLHALGVLGDLGKAIGAVAIVATMLGLLAGPWLVRLVRSLSFERAARIREQERAELAAHLHDSVLQTLALIQKRAADPREVAGLARRQERELRRWLFDRPGAECADSVKALLGRAAVEVEELHGVPVELVVVGDAPVDARLEALVQAAREALTNAAKFSGAERVDLYVEIGPSRVEAFVRDRGVGFDPAAIPDDRRGVRDSIVGRIERHGGGATIRSEPGAGTEVELVVERARGERGLVSMSPVGSA
ncbi:MAG TPA: PspC domain-containing protein [Solirubrobacteraceae bacterium]